MPGNLAFNIQWIVTNRLVFFACFVYFLLLITHSSFSQELTFNRVPPPGSSYSGSFGGAQDPQGYMWIAQIGLHRYDGYKYTSYLNDPLNPASLANNRLEAICVGRNGIVWVGIYGYGLDRLDPVTGIFTHYRYNEKNANSLGNDTVFSILEDAEGIIWVGTINGLNRLDTKTNTISRYVHNPSDPTTLSHNQIKAIYRDRQGTLLG